MSKAIMIIGSTGSVGTSALSVATKNKEWCKIHTLCASSNYKKLAQQAIEHNVKCVIITNAQYYYALKELLSSHAQIKVLAGKDAILDMIKQDIIETVLLSSTSLDSIDYLIACLEYNKHIAIANKESIVSGGEFIKNKFKDHKNLLVPVDSEHSAIFTTLDPHNRHFIDKVLLTSSGGPFANYTQKQLQQVTLKQALKHPVWSMGQKISIDSATMVNKGLELIETCYLFNLTPQDIIIKIEPSAILHGGVFYKDGTFIGNFSEPSMEIPIGYALAYPYRIYSNNNNLNIDKLNNLNLTDVNENTFCALKLAKLAVIKGYNYPCAFNCANEYAVDLFLNNKIKFLDIINFIEYTLDNTVCYPINSVADIKNSIQESLQLVQKCYKLYQTKH